MDVLDRAARPYRLRPHRPVRWFRLWRGIGARRDRARRIAALEADPRLFRDLAGRPPRGDLR